MRSARMLRACNRNRSHRPGGFQVSIRRVKMTTWNQLTDSEKLTHNAAVAKALYEYEELANKVKVGHTWVGKNGPPAAPFGRETVETRNLAALAEKAHAAMTTYESLLAKSRAF